VKIYGNPLDMLGTAAGALVLGGSLSVGIVIGILLMVLGIFAPVRR